MDAGDLLGRLIWLHQQVEDLAGRVVHARDSIRGRAFHEFACALALLQAAERVLLVDGPEAQPEWRREQRRHEIATTSAMAQLEELDPESVDFLVDFALFVEALEAHGAILRERVAGLVGREAAPVPTPEPSMNPLVKAASEAAGRRPFAVLRRDALAWLRSPAAVAGACVQFSGG